MFFNELMSVAFYDNWNDVPKDDRANLFLSFVNDKDYGNPQWLEDSFSGEGNQNLKDAIQNNDVFNNLALKIIASTFENLENYHESDGPVLIPSSLAKSLINFSKKGFDLCEKYIGTHIEDNYYCDAQKEFFNEYENDMQNYYGYDD